MTTYAIIAPGPNAALTEAVKRVFPDNFFEFAPGQFVAVAAEMTSRQVGEALGPSGQVGQFIVFTVGGNWGYHRRDLWEWMAVRAT